MKPFIASALGILFLASPLATAQTAAQAKSRGFIQRAIQIKQQQEKERRDYENSPEHLRQQIEIIRQQQARDRTQQQRDQQARDMEADARQREEWRQQEIQRSKTNGTRYSPRR